MPWVKIVLSTMVKLELSGFSKEKREELGEFISILEYLASDAYRILLKIEKDMDRPLTRTEIAYSLDESIKSTLEVLQNPKNIAIIRESLIDHYYRERKEPFTV